MYIHLEYFTLHTNHIHYIIKMLLIRNSIRISNSISIYETFNITNLFAPSFKCDLNMFPFLHAVIDKKKEFTDKKNFMVS